MRRSHSTTCGVSLLIGFPDDRDAQERLNAFQTALSNIRAVPQTGAALQARLLFDQFVGLGEQHGPRVSPFHVAKRDGCVLVSMHVGG
jgi:hypothetical protein